MSSLVNLSKISAQSIRGIQSIQEANHQVHRIPRKPYDKPWQINAKKVQASKNDDIASTLVDRSSKVLKSHDKGTVLPTLSVNRSQQSLKELKNQQTLNHSLSSRVVGKRSPNLQQKKNRGSYLDLSEKPKPGRKVNTDLKRQWPGTQSNSIKSLADHESGSIVMNESDSVDYVGVKTMQDDNGSNIQIKTADIDISPSA